MSDGPANENTAGGYFDRLYARERAAGAVPSLARAQLFDAYLDGKPAETGSRKLSRADRDRLFWDSKAAAECVAEDWQTVSGQLALVRYLSQDKVDKAELLDGLARSVPDALVLAVRRSALVSRPESPHQRALREAAVHSDALAELCRVLDIFEQGRALRQDELSRCQAPFETLSAIELLAWASLYAFEELVPHALGASAAIEQTGIGVEQAWDAINEMLIWKLRTAQPDTLSWGDEDVAQVVGPLFQPWLFPEQPPSEAQQQRYADFHIWVAAQIEWLEFMSRSVDAFCYDDAIRFQRRDQVLEIVRVDAVARAAWQRDTRKLWRLRGYWFARAFDVFARSDMAHQCIGLPENEDDNRLAWIKALATRMRLEEVYGVGAQIRAEGGRSMDVFQALLAQELTAIFFLRDFVAAFCEHAQACGHWLPALGRLALQGMLEGLQNRLPFTWSDRGAKVWRITGWTVTPEQRQGSAEAAQTILDFWTYDMPALAKRLQRGEPGLAPRLFERPVLRFGRSYVQLPWIGAFQNNDSAAINNLRRLGARRREARDETQRIESKLSAQLEARGFRVVLNWMPPAEFSHAGEVDVLAARDGQLFVLELKSTFLRESMREAWLHASTTLRKAGHQLTKKRAAVLAVLAQPESMLWQALGLAAEPAEADVHAWIVDTSIECDHQRFSGCLKLSLEELLIALRDERDWLSDPLGLRLAGLAKLEDGWADTEASERRLDTLYPHGFDAMRLVEVITTEAVWREP